MRSLERIITTLGGGIPDRVPVITFTNIAAGNLGEELTKYILENADAQFEFWIKELHAKEFPGIGVEFTREDIVSDDGWITRTYKTPSGKSFTEQFCLSAGGMFRSYKKHIFQDISELQELLSLPYIKPENNAAFINDVISFCQIQDIHNTKHEFCCIHISDPLFFLAGNTDPQDMSLWTLLERSTVNQYLSEITRRMIEYIDYLLSQFKMDCILMIGGAEYGIPPLMSPADFEEFVFHNDRQIVDVIHRYGKKVMIHCHGKINRFVPRFIEMGGDGIHPLEPVGTTGDCDIVEIKEKYGKDICLVGNIQYEDFQNCSEYEIDKIVADLMSAAKENGGFILSPACPMYHNQTTAEKINRNIRAFIDAGIKYGEY